MRRPYRSGSQDIIVRESSDGFAESSDRGEQPGDLGIVRESSGEARESSDRPGDAAGSIPRQKPCTQNLVAWGVALCYGKRHDPQPKLRPLSWANIIIIIMIDQQCMIDQQHRHSPKFLCDVREVRGESLAMLVVVDDDSSRAPAERVTQTCRAFPGQPGPTVLLRLGIAGASCADEEVPQTAGRGMAPGRLSRTFAKKVLLPLT